MRLSLFLILISIATSASKRKSKSKNILVHELNDDNFETITQAYKGSTNDWLVLFVQPWCPKSQELSVMWNNLATEMKANYHFGKIEISSNLLTAGRFNVQRHPSIILLHEGSYFTFDKTPKTLVQLERFANYVWKDQEGTRVIAVEDYLAFLNQLYQDLKLVINRKASVSAVIFIAGMLLGGMLTVMLVTLCAIDDAPMHSNRSAYRSVHDAMDPLNPVPLIVRVKAEEEDDSEDEDKGSEYKKD